MRSLVNWTLLGLVIDHPSYAYELARRFERTFGDALSLSSVSHVYTALGTLTERELIEELPGTRAGRQPKPHYRASEKGIGEYQQWLIGQIAEDRRRQRLFVLQLGALKQRPQAALQIIEHYERACLQEARQRSFPPIADAASEQSTELVSQLIGEESRLVIAARLAWAHFARSALGGAPLAREQSARRSSRASRQRGLIKPAGSEQRSSSPLTLHRTTGVHRASRQCLTTQRKRQWHETAHP